MPDGPIRTGINTSESKLRENVATLSNLSPAMDAMITATGGNPPLLPNELPTVGSLANLKATTSASSTARAAQANALINSLPQYTKGYREYLKWRYPSRYGGRRTGTTYPIYTGGAGAQPTGGGIPKLSLPPVTTIPGD